MDLAEVLVKMAYGEFPPNRTVTTDDGTYRIYCTAKCLILEAWGQKFGWFRNESAMKEPAGDKKLLD